MFFAFFRPLLTIWLKLMYPFKIHGKENLIQDGNTVIICNHLCKIDVPYVGYLFKGKTFYLAKKEWFNKKWRAWIFSKMGGIPIDRDNVDLAAMRTALKVLKDGKRLCIFPEGTRNKSGNNEIMELHGGAAIFAFKTNAKVLPINIHEKAKPFHVNHVYIGKAFDFSEFSGQKLNSELNEILTEKMYSALCTAKKELDDILEEQAAKKNKKR